MIAAKDTIIGHDRSVRDHPQQAVVCGDTITLIHRVGRHVAGRTTLSVAAWNDAKRFPNPNYSKRELVGKVFRSQPHYDPEQCCLGDRIIDSCVSAITKAIG